MKWLGWFITSVLITIGGPSIALAVDPNNAMLFCMFLFFVLNPLWALYSGILAGKDIKKRWCLPPVTVVLFVIGAWWLLSMDIMGLCVYSPIYLAVGVIAMAISALIQSRQKRTVERRDV